MTPRLLLSVVSAMVAILTPNRAFTDVIYDNTNAMFKGSVNNAPAQLGEEIIPAGTARIVTLLRIGVYSQSVPTTATLQAFLYANDGTGGQPGSLLWESAVMNSVPISGASNDLINFPVPNVLVPGDFTWTLQFTSQAGPMFAGLPSYGPPSVGSSVAEWSGQPGAWQKLPSAFDFFLSSVTAVPEPPSALPLSVGSSLVFILALIKRNGERGSAVDHHPCRSDECRR
jgi:hypothetical protein